MLRSLEVRRGEVLTQPLATRNIQILSHSNRFDSTMRPLCLTVVTFLALLGTTAAADEPTSGELRYWKGNIHTHSLWSDGDDFPEMIAEWYRTHDYHFLALSDHNVLSQGMRWMKASRIASRGGATVIPKYINRFGQHWVETRGDKDSDDYEVRLKPLDEFRYLLEERGKFIMIPGEEISDSSEGVPVHMNATNILELIEPQGGANVRESMANNLRAVEAQAKAAGREILLHLNHPNFGYAITAEDIAAVIQERFFEVYNGHPAVGHRGDGHHPGIERLWDIANTIRLGELQAPPLYGVATDDSHTYHGKPGAHTGRGWVMVRARYLSPEHLIRAMRTGDFYASSGVSLASIAFDDAAKTLTVEVASQAGESYMIEFIGTRKGYDRTSLPRQDEQGKRVTRKYSTDVGATLQSNEGSRATYQFVGDELYVRAVVTSSAASPDASFSGQHQQAWTQPFVLPRSF